MVEYLNLALREQGITIAIGRFGNGCSSVWMFCILAGLAQPLGRSACCGMRSQVQILPAIHQSEQRKLKMCELERDISELDSLRAQLAKANERADYYMKLITSDIGYEHAKDLEKGILEEIENRDNREEWLDKLSVEIARYFGVDIGEHSSANNPWVEAFEAIPEDTLNKFAIEKKIEALDDLLEEIQCSVVVPKRYEQFQEPYLEGIKHCIQFIECQQEQLRKEQE